MSPEVDRTGRGTEPPRARALRLTFTYDGERVALSGVEPVDATPFPPHSIVRDAATQGFWVELADSDGRAVYRRVLEDPLRRDVEVVTDDPRRPLARIPVAAPKGAFFVVVPYLPGARSVALFGAPGHGAGAARELHRFDLAGPSRKER